jgi:ribose transport system permease protein
MASNFSIGGIVAVGVFFPMLAGVFDLSISGVVSLCSVLIVFFFNNILPIPVIIFLCIGIGAAVGATNGFLTKIVGINPLITTIGTGSVLTGAAKWISTEIGSENIYNEGYLRLGSTFIGNQIPILLIYMIVIFVVAAVVLKYTRFGRRIYAVGGNFEIARMAGIPSARIQFSTYMISGCCAALAAVLLTSQLASGRPEFGATYTLDAIAVCVLGGLLLGGGKGDLFGLFVAVVLLGSVANGLIMLGLSFYIRFIVTGSILIISIVVNELRYRGVRQV